MSNPNISYHPLSNLSPEHELDTLAAVYKLAIDRYLERKAAEYSGGKDAKEGSKGDIRASARLP